MSSIEIFPEGTRFDGCSLITGFHGIGAAGYWTIKYLQDKLNVPRVAYVNSPIIPPVTSTSKGKLVSPFELYRKANTVFFKAEIPPQREEEIKFYGELANWIAGSGMKEVALVGGLDINLKHDETTFRLVHTSSYKPNGELEKALILEDDHLIVGPVAVMLNQFEMRGFPAYAILAYASPERMDPRAVAVSIGVLGKHYEFEVDVTPLIRGAEAIETEVAKRDNYGKKSAESMYA